jgi:hypothetical protein
MHKDKKEKTKGMIALVLLNFFVCSLCLCVFVVNLFSLVTSDIQHVAAVNVISAARYVIAFVTC